MLGYSFMQLLSKCVFVCICICSSVQFHCEKIIIVFPLSLSLCLPLIEVAFTLIAVSLWNFLHFYCHYFLFKKCLWLHFHGWWWHQHSFDFLMCVCVFVCLTMVWMGNFYFELTIKEVVTNSVKDIKKKQNSVIRNCGR